MDTKRRFKILDLLATSSTRLGGYPIGCTLPVHSNEIFQDGLEHITASTQPLKNFQRFAIESTWMRVQTTGKALESFKMTADSTMKCSGGLSGIETPGTLRKAQDRFPTMVRIPTLSLTRILVM